LLDLSALVILLLVARGEAGDPTTLGAVRATHELLGQDLRVEVREVETTPPDERALELGRDLGAAAIIELSWESPEHRQARVHFHLEPHTGWNDRVIGFMAADDMVERGRTVGFAIASMIPASPHGAEALRVWTAPPETSERDPQAPATLRPARRWLGTVDALGSTAPGIRGESPGWGGAASARWYFAPPFGLRLGVSARAGEIDPAQATTLHMSGRKDLLRHDHRRGSLFAAVRRTGGVHRARSIGALRSVGPERMCDVRARRRSLSGGLPRLSIEPG
jgi:hypothetical protein